MWAALRRRSNPLFCHRVQGLADAIDLLSAASPEDGRRVHEAAQLELLYDHKAAGRNARLPRGLLVVSEGDLPPAAGVKKQNPQVVDLGKRFCVEGGLQPLTHGGLDPSGRT